MAQRKMMEAKDLGGLFIEHDPKRGCVFYDIFTKKGYIITNADVKTYNLYSLSLPIGIMIAYVLTLFNIEFYVSALIGVVAYIVLKMIFRFKFIYTLPEIPGYERANKGSFFEKLINKYGTRKLATVAFLFAAIAIATVVDMKITGYTGMNLYLNYGIAAIVSVASVVFLIATIKSLGDK